MFFIGNFVTVISNVLEFNFCSNLFKTDSEGAFNSIFETSFACTYVNQTYLEFDNGSEK